MPESFVEAANLVTKGGRVRISFPLRPAGFWRQMKRRPHLIRETIIESQSRVIVKGARDAGNLRRRIRHEILHADHLR